MESGSSSWSIGNLLDSVQSLIPDWGGTVLMIAGMILMVWMGVLLVMKFLKKGQDQTSWGLIIAGLIVGGALAFGGWELISDIGEGGRQTIDELGRGG